MGNRLKDMGGVLKECELAAIETKLLKT